MLAYFSVVRYTSASFLRNYSCNETCLTVQLLSEARHEATAAALETGQLQCFTQCRNEAQLCSREWSFSREGSFSKATHSGWSGLLPCDFTFRAIQVASFVKTGGKGTASGVTGTVGSTGTVT